jgi:hypothetical protein
MCIYCYTFIQLNDYWKKKFGLVINTYIIFFIDNWSQFILQRRFTIKHMNNLIKDLYLEKEVSLFDENIDIDEDIDDNIWKQKNLYFDYCLKDCKKGQTDTVNSVGKIIPTEIMDKIMDSENDKTIHDDHNNSYFHVPINGKFILIQFLGITQSAYETD